MANLNTFSDISSYVNDFLDDALLYARENNLMASLVTNFAQQGSNPRKLYEYSDTTVNAIGESDDLTSQAFTPSLLNTLTPVERGEQFFISDQRLDTDPWGARSDAVAELGQKFGQKIDADLVSLFGSLTGGTIQPTLNMTWAAILAAETNLRAQFAPKPYVCVMHPYQWGCLGTGLVAEGGALQDEFASNWFVGHAYGIDFFVDGNITAATAAGGTKAGMFSKMALALDTRRAPRLEIERDASRRGYEFNMSAVYAFGPWRPKWGVQILSSASAPVA
jgi:hypothetical protein